MTAPPRPGEGRKWKVLGRLAESPWPLTVRDMADLYGWEGDPPLPGMSRNGSEWQNIMTHVAADFRYLHEGGWIRSRGKRPEGWGGGNPRLWEITQKGRFHLDHVTIGVEDNPVSGAQMKRDRAAARAAEKARTQAIADEVKALYPDGMGDKAKRNALSAEMKAQGLTNLQIANVWGLTPQAVSASLRLHERGEDDG